MLYANGWYQWFLLIHTRINEECAPFYNYMTTPLEKAGRSPALPEAARVHQKILSKLRAAASSSELNLCLVGMVTEKYIKEY